MTILDRSPALAAVPAPTAHAALLSWVAETAALTEPAAVVWCDGTATEHARLTGELVANGTFVPLDPRKHPGSFACFSDPSDVARVEERTFICSERAEDAGPTNNWMAPADMERVMTGLYRGCMRGRTMYVIPFCMGPLDAPSPVFGVEITDSPYVVVSMRTMARVGRPVLDRMGTDAAYIQCLHSVGAPLQPGQGDVPWPCNATKYISHFPEQRRIWSFGSGYGGNALLGKKCLALRIASVAARDEGWLAEHMLILKLTSPWGRVDYVAAAFPSACGKTNLAMLEPSLPGWTVETIGDDIAWLRYGADGRLYASNPEAGFFGVAPGTGWATNANAMRTIEQGSTVFTNVALTRDGDVWWEGLTDEPPAGLTDWRGRAWSPDLGEPAAHPNARFCTPAAQCPTLAEEWDSREGVPLSAILLGGRRQTTVPLVAEARDWQHAVFLGATLSSETTAAAAGAVGIVRRDPFAMLPFIGYHAADYFAHWLEVGERAANPDLLPRVYYVNWFRRGNDGRWLWPGFAENSRVLAWIVGRLEGTAGAVDTPVGRVPAAEDLDLGGLATDPTDIAAALAVDPAEWRNEVPEIEQWLHALGPKVPAALHDELARLRRDLNAA